MIKTNFLENLPGNFKYEKSFLIKNKINDSRKLSRLSDCELNIIQQTCLLCSLNNLKKIRAIAIFNSELSISPNESYLLLHCGISSIKSLATLNPHDLKVRIGKLERILGTKSRIKIPLPILKDWILRANQICKSI